MKAKFLAKTTTDVLEDKIKYSQKLIDMIEKETSCFELAKLLSQKCERQGKGE